MLHIRWAIYCIEPGFTSNENDDYNKNTFWTGLYNQRAEFRAAMSPRPEDMYSSDAYEARLFDETAKVVDYFYPEYLPKNIFLEDEDDSERFATLKISLKEYVKTSMAQFIRQRMRKMRYTLSFPFIMTENLGGMLFMSFEALQTTTSKVKIDAFPFQ